MFVEDTLNIKVGLPVVQQLDDIASCRLNKEIKGLLLEKGTCADVLISISLHVYTSMVNFIIQYLHVLKTCSALRCAVLTLHRAN